MSMTAPKVRSDRFVPGPGPRGSNQRGFNLIEVLVTIVVLAIGLLGLAGLQAHSLKNSHSSLYRTIASQQAYDIADRIAANLAGVAAGHYDNLTATLPSDPNCIATGCSTANMALTDQFQWLRTNAVLLPNGSGTVQCAIGPAGNRICVVTTSWTERTEGSNLTQSFVTQFAP
jgi:type IV pilus assembly protein PilV